MVFKYGGRGSNQHSNKYKADLGFALISSGLLLAIPLQGEAFVGINVAGIAEMTVITFTDPKTRHDLTKFQWWLW